MKSFLEKLYENNPHTTQLILSGKELTELDTLMEIILKFDSLIFLDISDNELQELPLNFTELKELEILNINNNPFSSFKEIINIIKHLPNLKNLTMHLENHSQVKLILKEIKGIKVLNNEFASQEEVKEIVQRIETIPEESEGREEIEKAEIEIGKILSLYNMILQYQKRSPDNYLENFIKGKIEKIKEEVKEESLMLDKKIMLYKAISSMLEICFDKLLERERDPLHKILIEIKNSYIWIQDSILQAKFILEDSIDEKDDAVLNKEKIAHLNRNFSKEKEPNILKKQGVNLKIIEDNQIDYKINCENFKILEKTKKDIEKKSDPFSNNNHLKPEPQTGNLNNIKPLSIRQLKELIEDIYIQKERFDLKCLENKESKQTLDQFIYTYLNQLYGLKSIIIGWTNSIITAITKYSSEDNDIALFGKILRNECEEDFRFEQMKIKNNVHKYLREKIISKNKLKTEIEISKIIKQLMKGVLKESYWNYIIRKMYSEDYCNTLSNQIRQIIKSKNINLPKKEINRKLTRVEQEAIINDKEFKILYTEFVKILLDFQLKNHENYLKKFTNLFNSIDQDMNGILNEEEFKLLVEHMKMDSYLACKLLQIIDPNNLQSITYSDCISVFSSQAISKGNTILEKFLKEDIN